MGVRRNFRRGGGGSLKEAPHKDKKGPLQREKVAERPPHNEKGPHEEKK